MGGIAEVMRKGSRRGEGLLYLRREAWIGFCWQAEGVLDLFGLSVEAIEDCGARVLKLMHAMPRLMKLGKIVIRSRLLRALIGDNIYEHKRRINDYIPYPPRPS